MNKTVEIFDVERLRNLIGKEVSHNGKSCHIIEVLEDGPALILQQSEFLTRIQADQHGEAHRKVPTTITVPVLDDESEAFSGAFNALDVQHLL